MRTIDLTQGQVALVDDEDYEALAEWKWYALWNDRAQNFYAMRKSARINGQQAAVPMHVVVAAPPAGMHVDHRNHNGLDNQRANLRLVTHSQNQMNSLPRGGISRYKGVSRNREKWQARIKVDGKQSHLGIFTDEEDAARAYDAAARELFGEFAYLNFGGE